MFLFMIVKRRRNRILGGVKKNKKTEKNSTKANALDDCCIGYVEEMSHTQTKSVTQIDASFTSMDLQSAIKRAVQSEMTQISENQNANNAGNTNV